MISPGDDAGPAPAGRGEHRSRTALAARAAERPPTRSEPAHEAAPRSSGAESADDDAQRTAAPPLTPEAERARLHKVMDGSRAAAGDALDRKSREIASDLVAELRTHSADATLQAVDCRAAGRTATLELPPQADRAGRHRRRLLESDFQIEPGRVRK